MVGPLQVEHAEGKPGKPQQEHDMNASIYTFINTCSTAALIALARRDDVTVEMKVVIAAELSARPDHKETT